MASQLTCYTAILQGAGQSIGPLTLTTSGTSTSTFTTPLTAPDTPSTYPVTVNYTPNNPAFGAPTPPYSFNLPVGPATTTVTQVRWRTQSAL